MREGVFVVGNSRMQSNTRHLFLYRRTRVLANSSFYHFTFEMNQTHVKEHIYYYSLESREYSIPIFIIIIKTHSHFRLFFPCQEVSRKLLASTVCFSLFRMSCTVCCRPIQDFAFGSCDHKDLCANCMLHWLMLYKETTCPTCRVTLLSRYDD